MSQQFFIDSKLPALFGSHKPEAQFVEEDEEMVQEIESMLVMEEEEEQEPPANGDVKMDWLIY